MGDTSRGSVADSDFCTQGYLFANLEFFNEFGVSAGIGLSDVGQEATTVAHQLEQSLTGVKILLVGLQMIGEVGDALSQKRHLNFGGAGVFVVMRVRRDYLFFRLLKHMKRLY